MRIAPPTGLVPALDPQRILIGLAGDHAGQVCLRLDDDTVRPATPIEIELARLVCPWVQRWWEIRDRLPPLGGSRR